MTILGRTMATSVPSSSLLSFHGTLQRFQQSFPLISAPQLSQLEELCHRLHDWNSKINLISRKDVDLLVENHVLPSLAISRVVTFAANEKVVDVGTGGGFPGLPMAIVFPDVQFTLLDSNTKKMKVVQDIASNMRLSNVQVVTSRAESFREQHDFILGRAVSALPNFLSYSSHLIKSDNTRKDGIFYIKGGDFNEEIADANIKEWKVHPISALVSGLSTDKNILVIPRDEVLAFHSRIPRK